MRAARGGLPAIAASALLILFGAVGFGQEVRQQIELPIHEEMRITQNAGDPWSENPAKLHTGTDIAARKGTVVYATTDGTVPPHGIGKLGSSKKGEDWGWYLLVRRSDGSAVAFLHIDKPNFSVGDPVKAGSPIGKVFNNHLHYNECKSATGCQIGAVTPPEFAKGNYMRSTLGTAAAPAGTLASSPRPAGSPSTGLSRSPSQVAPAIGAAPPPNRTALATAPPGGRAAVYPSGAPAPAIAPKPALQPPPVSRTPTGIGADNLSPKPPTSYASPYTNNAALQPAPAVAPKPALQPPPASRTPTGIGADNLSPKPPASYSSPYTTNATPQPPPAIAPKPALQPPPASRTPTGSGADNQSPSPPASYSSPYTNNAALQPPPAIAPKPALQPPPASRTPTGSSADNQSPLPPASYSSPYTYNAALQPSPVIAPKPVLQHAPGGISLSKAAASRMALNITLEGAYYKDGRLVLSGRETSEQTLDSALLLTALRAACETGDPYFSLDPDSGAWLEEGEKAFATLWERVKADVGWERRVKADQRTVRSHSLLVRNIWARRDYPQLWSAIASEYPHLRSQLVFRPLWLQQTRFGEILYKADVLLKELASGTSVLEPGPLRAAGVDGYVSQLGRENANSLFASVHGQKIEKKWKASRLWFDIAPPTPTAGGGFDAQTIRSGADRELFATLKEHGLVPGDRPYSPPVLQLVKDGDALDLTKVFPTMFVRRHDFVRGVDLPDDDVVMNAFASDVNDSIEKYVSRYKELQALTEVVRAYVAAVHVANNNESICQRLSGFELLESEKMDRPLPAFHPSELNVMVARYAAGDGRRAVRTMFVSATTVQGGVTIAGKSFYSTGPVVAAATALTRSLKAETAQPAQSAAWKGAEGRQFIAFALNNDEQIGIQTVISVSPPGEVPDVPGAEITPDIEIENEPAAAIPPAH